MNNLKSYTEYAVSTPTTDFVIGFDFNYGTDAVNVTVDGVPATEAGYSVIYLNSTTMRLSPAVPTGVVRLQRETDIDVPDNQFTAGAKFIASNMDENFTQLRHAQQEVRDGFGKLSDDTYEIIDTLHVVGQAAQDAADAAEQAAQTANDAAAQVSDKVSYQDLNNAIADTPHNNMVGRDVAGAHPASAISYSGGSVADFLDNQEVLNASDAAFKANFVTPEMFGAKANDPSFDSTSAMNAALASGSTLYADATKTYYVSGALVGKGQPLVGGFKISSSKKVRPDFSGPIGLVQTTSPDVPDPSNIKFCFVQRSHDLVEFFKLRELGFNTILHYDLYLTGGTIQAVLDNAKTAGLRVIVGTENRSPNVDTQVAFWSAYDSHPALYAYSMFDEPVARVISLETQNAKLSKYRAMTEKPLTVTEYYFTSLSSVPMIFDYDIYFIHAYARNWTDTDVSVKVNKDLAAARKNTAYYTSIFKNKRIVPVIGLFTSSTNDGFSNNVDQIIRFATIYGQTHTGSLGVFIWDVMSTGIPDNLGNNLSFQKIWKRCLNTKSPKLYKSICFGQGSSSTYNFGLESIIDSPIKTFDASYAQNTNAYPVRIRTGTPESLFVTPAANATYAGIAFKTNNATYYSNILIGKFGTVYLWLTDMTSTFVGTINFYLSNDGGQTKTLVGTATSTTIDLTFANPFSSDAVLIIEVISTSTASEYFRRFLRGMIMSSEW